MDTLGLILVEVANIRLACVKSSREEFLLAKLLERCRRQNPLAMEDEIWQ